MYYLKGIEEVLKCVAKACSYSDISLETSSIKFIKSYNKFILSSSVFNSLPKSNRIKIVNFKEIKKLAPKFYSDKAEFFAENSHSLTKKLDNGFFEEALDILKSQSEELYNLIQFIIKVVLINQLSSYLEGTTEETIGLSSMDFKDDFEQQDFIELLVHQLTHMILFLDDLNQSHMLEQSKEVPIDIGLKSKSGGTEFPAYIAFHTYVVGVEVLNFRRASTGLEFDGKYHGTTKRIIRVCNEFHKGLSRYIHLFSKHGQQIFYEASISLGLLSSNYLAMHEVII